MQQVGKEKVLVKHPGATRNQSDQGEVVENWDYREQEVKGEKWEHMGREEYRNSKNTLRAGGQRVTRLMIILNLGKRNAFIFYVMWSNLTHK